MTDDDELEQLGDAARTIVDYLELVRLKASTRPQSSDEWLESRAQLGILLAGFDKAAKRLDKAKGLAGAEPKLLQYLKNHLGETVDKDQLRGVAGIYEFARRLRELRVESGWRISSSLTRDDLRSGQYLLEEAEPNRELAKSWRIAKSIRNLKVNGKRVGMKARYLAYLQQIHPESADKQQLAYVAYPGHEPRRIRELAEEGWQIESNVDDPALAPGSYRMISLDRLPPRARQAIKLRYQVFDRDGTRCVDCGRTPKKDKVQLQAHHLTQVKDGGKNIIKNLVTLCSDCHAGRHAVKGGDVVDELLHPEQA